MRHFFFFGCAAALLGAAYFLLLPRNHVVEGRVVVFGFAGEETAGEGAGLAVHPAEVVREALGSWLRDFDAHRVSNRLEVQAARKVWMQASARRDEAARILRVAEQANAADLPICQARHREAAADAEDALNRLQYLEAGFDEIADPAAFISGLPEPLLQTSAGTDGSFRLVVPAGEEVYLVANLPAPQSGQQATAWLRCGPFDDGERVQFSNANVLTAESLARLARAAKGPAKSGASPAG